MPRVGKKKFPYNKKGIAQAKAYAKKNDLPIIYEDAKAGMSVPSYAEGGGVRYYESQRAGASVSPYMPGGGGEGAGGMAAGAALGSALASRKGSSEEGEYAAPEGKTCPEGQVLDADGNCVVKWREDWEEGDNEGDGVEDFNPQTDPETGIGSDDMGGDQRRGVSEKHDAMRGTTRSYDEEGNMTRTNKAGNIVGGTKEQRIERNRQAVADAKAREQGNKPNAMPEEKPKAFAQANRKSERDQTPISLKERKVSSVGGGDKGGSALALGKPKGEGKGLGALAKNIGEKKGDGGGILKGDGDGILKGDGEGLASKLKGDGDGPLANLGKDAKNGAIVRPKRKKKKNKINTRKNRKLIRKMNKSWEGGFGPEDYLMKKKEEKDSKASPLKKEKKDSKASPLIKNPVIKYKHGGKVKANKKGVAIIIAIGKPRVNRKKK